MRKTGNEEWKLQLRPPLFWVSSYFVMGDNVSNALDSRYWGGLKFTKILGKVIGK